jgi:hypothetical protein
MAARRMLCPTCNHEIRDGDFLCVECETIVGPLLVSAIPEPPKCPSVVFSLLAPPDSSLDRKIPRPPPPPPPGTVDDVRMLATTRPFAIPADDRDVPRITAGLDLGSISLTEFDAYLLSLMDGRATVAALKSDSRLTSIELQSVLHSLQDRGLIELAEKPQPRRFPKDGPAPARQHDSSPPSSAFESPLQKAIALEASGQIGKAIRVLEGAIARSDDPAPLYNRLAIALIKERRDFDRADELLTKALALDPVNDVYRANLMKVSAMRAAVTGAHPMPRRKTRA